MKTLYRTNPLTRFLVLIRAGPDQVDEFVGFVSDRALLSYFHRHAQQITALSSYLSNSLHSLSLPSLNLRSAVVYCISSEPVLQAMKFMSEQGVSSVAIVKDTQGNASVTLLSAVSVTDIGKVRRIFTYRYARNLNSELMLQIVVPSQSKHILSTPLHQFVAQIKVVKPLATLDSI